MEENKNIEKAKEVLEKISQDEKERELAYRRERAIRDQNAIREAGYDAGKEDGKKEQKIEIARNLLNQKVDIDVIVIATGLSKEEIEKLK